MSYVTSLRKNRSEKQKPKTVPDSAVACSSVAKNNELRNDANFPHKRPAAYEMRNKVVSG